MCLNRMIYSEELDNKIIQYEEEECKKLKILGEKYRQLLRKYECNLEVKILWTNDEYESESSERLPFGEDYTNFVQFDFTHKGEYIFEEEGEIEYQIYEVVVIKKSWFHLRVRCSKNPNSGVEFLKQRAEEAIQIARDNNWEKK